MKAFRYAVVGLVIVALLVVAVGPASAATTYPIKINNQSKETFTITFTGSTIYTYKIVPGVNTVQLPAGKFTYRHAACGKTVNGNYTVTTKNNEKLVIKACPAGYSSGQTSSTGAVTTYDVKVNNQTGSVVSIAFTATGQTARTFTLQPGVNILKLPEGKWKYKYTACGDNTSGTYVVKTKNNPTLQIKACKAASLVTLRFNNRTGGLLNITLTGPQTYRLTLATGKTNVKVVKGNYTYSVWSVCGSTSGTIKVNRATDWDWWCR